MIKYKKIFLVLSFLFIFSFAIDVKAFTCVYTNNAGKSVAIEPTRNGSEIASFYYSYTSSSAKGEYFSFYPYNNIIKYNNAYTVVDGGYISGEQTSYSQSCPNSLDIYYKTSNSANYFIKIKEKTYPVVIYSNTGLLIDDNKLTTNSASYFADFSGYKPGDVSLITDSKKETFSLNKSKTTEANSGGSATTDPTTGDEYHPCTYKNYKSSNLFYFRIYKTGHQHYYWTGNDNKAAKSDRDNNNENTRIYANFGTGNVNSGYVFTGCPQYFKMETDEFFIPDSICNYDDGDCYYREDVKPTYSGNSSKVITYVSTSNYSASNYVRFQVLKDTSEGEMKVVLGNGTDITASVTNLSDYITKLLGTDKKEYPIYVYKTKDNKYIIANEKPQDIEIHDVYMLVTKMYETVGFGDTMVFNTCEQMFDENFINFLKTNVFNIIYIGIPILLLILTTFDFAKVVFVDDKEGIQAAGKKFGKRVIVALLIYFVPIMITVTTNIMGVDQIKKCVETFSGIKENYYDE